MIARMRSGFAVMGDWQYLKGYSVLLAYPLVGQLNDLDHAHRLNFLEDMARLGDAVHRATNCCRVNYSIYGNLDPFLHAHVWPRYSDEPEEFQTIPPFLIPEEVRQAPDQKYHRQLHGDLQRQIRDYLYSQNWHHI